VTHHTRALVSSKGLLVTRTRPPTRISQQPVALSRVVTGRAVSEMLFATRFKFQCLNGSSLRAAIAAAPHRDRPPAARSRSAACAVAATAAELLPLESCRTHDLLECTMLDGSRELLEVLEGWQDGTGVVVGRKGQRLRLNAGGGGGASSLTLQAVGEKGGRAMR
jgi:hypothetical protein